MLSEIERVLDASETRSLLNGHRCDFEADDAHQVQRGIDELRSHMAVVLERFGVAIPAPRIGALHSVETSLDHIDNELEELGPHSMKGYGALAPGAGSSLETAIEELQAIVRKTRAFVRKRRAQR